MEVLSKDFQVSLGKINSVGPADLGRSFFSHRYSFYFHNGSQKKFLFTSKFVILNTLDFVYNFVT